MRHDLWSRKARATRGSGGMLPPKTLKSGCSEMLFSAFFIRVQKVFLQKNQSRLSVRWGKYFPHASYGPKYTCISNEPERYFKVKYLRQCSRLQRGNMSKTLQGQLHDSSNRTFTMIYNLVGTFLLWPVRIPCLHPAFIIIWKPVMSLNVWHMKFMPQ